MSEIDPVQFGELLQSVRNIEKRMDNMEPKVDEMVAIKNKGKGYLAAIITFSGLIGAGIIEAIRHVVK